MKKDPKIFLQHIIDSIEKIEEYTEKMSREEFLADSKVKDAVVRNLEIIGEAVKNLPEDYKNSKEINWQEIAGMRDILIHHYFGVDFDIIWATIKKDIPALKDAISEILISL
ncbi:MAG: DUF86 domain-containing protein [bacterium]